MAQPRKNINMCIYMFRVLNEDQPMQERSVFR